MSTESWLLFLLVGSVAAISPGPGLLFTVSTALRYGAVAGFATGLVNAAGIALLAIAVGLGFSVLIAASTWAFLALKIFGAGYLVYLGIKIWRDRKAFILEAEQTVARTPYKRLAPQAALIALTNPKAMLLLTALMPPFISADAPAAPQALQLAIAYAGLCVGSHFLAALAAGTLRRVLTTPRRSAIFRRLVGAGFMGFGLALVATGRP